MYISDVYIHIHLTGITFAIKYNSVEGWLRILWNKSNSQRREDICHYWKNYNWIK